MAVPTTTVATTPTTAYPVALRHSSPAAAPFAPTTGCAVSRVPEHPSPYSVELLPVFAHYLPTRFHTVLDPMAGIGRVHLLESQGHETWGIEIEREWARAHPRTMTGNCLHMKFPTGAFDAILVSPCYGNRMADHHNAQDDSKRWSYKHCLGRDLHADNSGAMQWGERYREFHERAWEETVRVLRDCGRFVLNISDHYRNLQLQPVTDFHVETLRALGLRKVAWRRVHTPRRKIGAAKTLKRVGYESVVVFDKR